MKDIYELRINDEMIKTMLAVRKQFLLPTYQGFIAQLVEYRTGIVEVIGSNPVVALIFFFRLKIKCNCLNCLHTARIISFISIPTHGTKISDHP